MRKIWTDKGLGNEMKKGEIFEGVVEDLNFPDRGLLHVEGEAVLVKRTLPGQKIRSVAGKHRSGRWEGRLLEVLEVSSLETEENFCPHFGVCGGCSYQSLPYEEQLKLKEGMVRKLIGEYCPGSVFEGIAGSPLVFSYRNKMEYSFGDAVKGGPLTLGMHKRGSFHDIVTVEDCRIADEDFQKILTETLELCREEGLSFYRKMKHEGYLRHLLIRKGWKTGEILTALVTSGQTGEMESEEKFLNRFASMVRSIPLKGRLAGVLHMRNDSPADVVRSDRTTVLHGQDFFFEELLGLRFKITPFSFFQTNSSGAEVLYRTVRDYAGEAGDGLIYDLYSGTGTIAQVLAPVAKKVIGVEIVEEAVAAARENADLNGLRNCEFLAGDVLKTLDSIKERPELIVLDPPREGIHPKALPKILAYGVERIVYVSCKPTSLARDLKEFAAAGYQVQRACCVDMFPGTANIETVVMLSHKKPDSVINVKVEFGEGEGKVPLDNIAKRAEAYKPKERVTYKMIKEYIEAKYGFKVHTAYIAEVKRELGLPMYDAPNAVEELKQPRKHPTAEKAEAIKDALKHFEVI